MEIHFMAKDMFQVFLTRIKNAANLVFTSPFQKI